MPDWVWKRFQNLWMGARDPGAAWGEVLWTILWKTEGAPLSSEFLVHYLWIEKKFGGLPVDNVRCHPNGHRS